MIWPTRKTLAMTAVATVIIALAVASSIWWIAASPAGRDLTLSNIRSTIVFGAITGGALALLAIGFTLVYGVAEMVNMAHGALFMLGAYTFWALTTSETGGLFEPIQLDLRLAFVLAVILTGIVGAIVYRLTMQPILEDIVAVLVVTVGVIIIFQEIMVIQFKGETRPVIPLIGGETSILGVGVPNSELLVFGSSLCLFAVLWMFITKLKIGKAMRAVAQDHEVATLMGINTDRLYMLTMAISASLAAIAGILWSFSTMGQSIRPYMWDTPLYFSFAIVILGGLGSIKGTFIGAFIVGYTEVAFIFFGPGGAEFLKGAVALSIMVLVLLLKPKGLFGKRIEMEE